MIKMGQRSQIIVIHEGVHYNNDNPNDNNGKVYVSHNQWRYGANAIYILKHLIDKYNVMIKNKLYNDKSPYFFSCLNEIFDSCVSYAENYNINYDFSKSHDFKDSTEEFVKSKDLIDFCNNYTDNNNGWFFIKVMQDKTLQIGILNGLEDDETIKLRTPEEYIKLFNEPDQEDLENCTFLNKFKVFDPIKEFKKEKDRMKQDFKEV